MPLVQPHTLHFPPFPGGVEIGQGLYTKVAQAVAYKLGIDISLISVVPTSSDATPAMTVTGGSGTSETSVMVRVWLCRHSALAVPMTRSPCVYHPILASLRPLTYLSTYLRPR